jgi:ParB family chromosome partitioning protein
MKDSKQANGAEARTGLLLYDPTKLLLVQEKEGHPLYDEDRAKLEVNESLVLDLMFHGILEPIIVRKDPESGAMEVVAGTQRVKACIEANKRLKKQGKELLRVPATVRRGDAAALMGLQISENAQREDESPLGKAKKIERYLALGRSPEEAAARFRMSAASVKNMVNLLSAPRQVRTAVQNGEITASDGYKLARLQPAEAKKRVQRLAKEAPKAKGKRKGKAAKKAREILSTGKPNGKRKETLEGVMRIRWDATAIEAMRREVAETLAIGEDYKKHLDSVFAWVLGDDLALDVVLGKTSVDDFVKTEDEEVAVFAEEA